MIRKATRLRPEYEQSLNLFLRIFYISPSRWASETEGRTGHVFFRIALAPFAGTGFEDYLETHSALVGDGSSNCRERGRCHTDLPLIFALFFRALGSILKRSEPSLLRWLRILPKRVFLRSEGSKTSTTATTNLFGYLGNGLDHLLPST